MRLSYLSDQKIYIPATKIILNTSTANITIKAIVSIFSIKAILSIFSIKNR